MSYTIATPNVAPGMVLDFKNAIAQRGDETVLDLGECEVVSVESPDGLGAYYGIWATSETDGTEVYVQAGASDIFEIVG